jgi:predicted  nucleic acid-binding Zn-ribbon protein
MWQKLLEFGKELLSLKKQTEVNTSDIKEIRQDIKDLAEAVRKLTDKMERNQLENDYQQKITIEQLKNALLQLENNFLKGKYSNRLDRSDEDDNS